MGKVMRVRSARMPVDREGDWLTESARGRETAAPDTGLTLADSRSLDSLVSQATTCGNLSGSCPPSPPISARMHMCARPDAWRWYGMGRPNGVDVDDDKSGPKKRRASGRTATSSAHRVVAGALMCFMLGLLLAQSIQSIAHAGLGQAPLTLAVSQGLRAMLHLPVPTSVHYKSALWDTATARPGHVLAPCSAAPPPADVLVGVMSAYHNAVRRDAVRATWMRFRHPHMKFRVVFVLGDVPKANQTTIRAEMVRNCDIVQAPVAETYNSLTVKTLHLFMHAADMQPWAPLYVLKTDDDTFLRMDRLLSELYTPPRAGPPRNTNATGRECLYWGKGNWLDRSLTQLPVTNKWHIPPQLYPYDHQMPLGYMQGGGYVLSMPLVEAIVHELRNNELEVPLAPSLGWLEDAAVGYMLRALSEKTGTLHGHPAETCYVPDRRWSGEAPFGNGLCVDADTLSWHHASSLQMYGMYLESTKATGGSMCRCAQPSYGRHLREVGRPSALYRFPPAGRWVTGAHVQRVVDCARAAATAATAAAADPDDGAPPRLVSMGSWGSGLLMISGSDTALRTRMSKGKTLSLQEAMADEQRFSALTMDAARLSAGRWARRMRGSGRGSVKGVSLDGCPLLEATSVSSVVRVYVRELDGPAVELRINSTDLQELRAVFDYGLYDTLLREGLPPENVKGILDAHAGAGYSAIQIARRFPMAVVVALETDADAFALLVHNTAAYPNVIPVRARIRGATVQRATGEAGGAQTGGAQAPLFFPPALNTSNNASILELAEECGVAAFDVVLMRQEKSEQEEAGGDRTLAGAEAWLGRARQWMVDWGADETQLPQLLETAHRAGFTDGLSLYGGLLVFRKA